MKLLYTLPWVTWFLWFVAWEAWGFKSNRDEWPTLSQLVKWWEVKHQMKVIDPGSVRTTVVVDRGISAWTWRRWFVAAGLPVLAFILELHWVWELF